MKRNVVRDLNGSKCLIVHGEWNTETEKYMAENEDISEVEMRPSLGCQARDLKNLLRYSKRIKKLLVIADSVSNGSLLEEFLNLELLHFNAISDQKINFEKLQNMNRCLLQWTPKMKSISLAKSLKELILIGYRQKNVEDLSKLSLLKSLSLHSTSIKTLSGISELTELEELSVLGARSLESVEDITSCNNLISLELGSCTKVDITEALFEVISLCRLKLENCGTIASLKGIERLTHLSTLDFSGNTNISDGDMSPLLASKTLKSISYQNRKHYSHRLKALLSIKFPDAVWVKALPN